MSHKYLGRIDALCIHMLGSMLSIFVALNRGMSSKELDLMYDEENVGYIQCLDLGSPHTFGGTVLFET